MKITCFVRQILVSLICSILLVCISGARADERPVYKIRMQWLPQAQFAGMYMAKNIGLFSRAGVRVEISHPRHGENLFVSLDSGECDLVVDCLINAIRHRLQNENICQVVQFMQKSSELLVAKKSSGIRTMKDLQNKNIGMWVSEGLRISYKQFLRHHGISNYTILPKLTNEDIFLYDGVAAVTVMSYNEFLQIRYAGFLPEDLVIFRLEEVFPDLVTDGLYCRRNLTPEQQEDMRKIGEAAMEGWRRAFRAKELALRMVKKECDLHNEQNPAFYAEFSRAHQRKMLMEIERLMLGQQGDGVLRKQSFEQALKILNCPPDKLGYENFMLGGLKNEK